MVMLGLVSIGLFVNNLILDGTWEAASFYDSISTEFLLIGILPLFWLISFVKSDLPKANPKALIVLLSWSFYLWQGITMGYMDALLRRNGH